VNQKTIRQRILDRARLIPAGKTKKLQSAGDYPDSTPKTPTMKLLEYKYNIRIENTIFNGSLNDVVKLLHGDVDRSTISKWRKKLGGTQ